MTLSIDHLSKSFDGVTVLNKLSLSAAPGEILAVVGPNGSGKTTLLDVIVGLVKPSAGTVLLGDESLLGLRAHEIAAKGVARTFQTARLFRSLSVVDNLVLASARTREGLLFALVGRDRQQEKVTRERALKVLERLGMREHRDALAAELSLGQMRRVELARLMMHDNTRLLLLDEPTGSLDPAMTELTMTLIREFRASGKTVVLVEHNLRVVDELADRVIVLHQGQTFAEGTPAEVLRDPRVVDVYLAQGRQPHASAS